MKIVARFNVLDDAPYCHLENARSGRVGCGWPLTVCSAGEPKAEWLALKLPSRELAGKRKHAFDDAQVLQWDAGGAPRG